MFQRNSNHASSYYASTCTPPERPAQTENIDTGVLIVGAGFSGLHTALRLVSEGKRVTVIDSSRVGWAATGRNGGMAILGWSSDMDVIEQSLGWERTRALWKLMRWAAAEVKELPLRHGFQCDYQEGHLWTSVLPRRVQMLREWQESAIKKWGYENLQFVEKRDMPNWVASERYVAGLFDPEAGHLNPLKLALGLAAAVEKAGGVILEQTRALSYRDAGDRVVVTTDKGQIHCDTLVLACNAYIDELDPALSRKVLPVGTFVVTSEVLSPERAKSLIPSNACVTDNQFILDYFRLTPDHRLLFGGGCTYLGGIPRDIGQAMRSGVRRVFPALKNVKFDFAWGGHIDITMNRAPDIGFRNNIYWMQGFSGHGLLPTCVAGRVVADAILGRRDHIDLFMAIKHLDFPGGKRLAPWLEAAGKMWYRLRDVI